MLAAEDDPLDPHVIPEAGMRAKALCGYAPYSHWKGVWVRPKAGLEMAALCPRCRTGLTGAAATGNGPGPLVHLVVD